ncbi:MAG: DNA-protecting protein DprA [Prevotella sp.]|jgi:predicted Rossmann fold nucleotide-binding protein DprA/Smf involved in DNA uptake|nr:DNA-protecting protein DprA [Prevotella sp.]
MNTRILLAFSFVNELRSKGKFIKKYRNKILSCVSLEDLCGLYNHEKVITFSEKLCRADEIMSFCKESSIHIISILSPDYPLKLLDMNNPPIILFAKGNLELLNKRIIAIIGTRHSTDLGNAIANSVGHYFSKNNAICNGLVEGIDMYSVLDGTSTFMNVIGVLPGGVNYRKTCTRAHAMLIDKVYKNDGLLISEFTPNEPENKFSGAKASCLQAGISDALVLVQSSEKGGSKYTLRAFTKLSRPIGIISCKNSIEFQESEAFNGNRLILDKKINGIKEFCEMKENIKTSDIIALNNKSDYQYLLESIKNNGRIRKMNLSEGNLF